MKARLALLFALTCSPACAQGPQQVPHGAPGSALRDVELVYPYNLREQIATALGPRVSCIGSSLADDGQPFLDIMMKSPSVQDAATVMAMLSGHTDRAYRIVSTHYGADEAQALQGQIAKALMANPAMNADMSGLHYDAARDRFVLGTVSGRTRHMQAFLSARGWANVPFEVIKQSKFVDRNH